MVDNEVQEVYYNNRRLNVSGHLKVWQSKKTIKFEPEGNGYGELKIKGVNYEGNDHCTWGGLVVLCKSSDGQGPWHNFKSDLAHWRSLENHTLCQSDGGVVTYPHLGQVQGDWLKNLLNAGAVKIWTNQKENTLIGSPLPVRK